MTHAQDIDGPRPTSGPARIAIDLDGVLTEHPAPLATAANEKFDASLPERAFVDSAGLNVPLEIREWVYSDHGPASTLRPAEGAQDFLRKIIQAVGEGNVLIITARPESAAMMTISWLKRNGFPTVNVLFTDDKMTLARRQGCDYAVEDSERHAGNYAAGGITCFLITRDGGHLSHLDPLIQPVRTFWQILQAMAPVASVRLRRQTVSADLPPMQVDGHHRRPRIVVSDTIHAAARAELEAAADIVDVDGTDVPALLTAVREADALVVRSETQVTSEVLAAAPKLRVVARAGVGVDNINLEQATRAGVLVLNAPGANANSAAEHSVALLLAVTRQIPFADRTTHAGEWARKLIKPVDLRDRTVGIVGLGRVGGAVAKRLKAFEMRVIAHDPHIPDARFEQLDVEPVSLDEIWDQSDIVTFHVPSTHETRHMLNAETVELLRPGAIVINAARGDVVDQDALADALRSGRIAGAAVDVFPCEPCHESPLFGLPNVVLTPHTGGSSAEALEAVGRVISSSTLAALRGESVSNGVNLPNAALDAPELKRLSTAATASGKLLAVLTSDVPGDFTLHVRGQVSSSLAELVLGTALAAALQQWLGRRVTPVNARVIATEIGIDVGIVLGDDDPDLMPRFVFSAGGPTSHSVTVSWDRTRAGIIEVDRFSLDRPLSGHVLITHHHDQPGVIGRLGTILGRHNVNIAGMQVGREAPLGEALMVTNVDEAIPEAAMDEIYATEGIEEAYVVALPTMDENPIEFSAIKEEKRMPAVVGS
ncbi:MAG TPA: phosphoglycerate dehydrogenase [Thermomicrobiales bacterium]|nr:phosphoglycerate dehydrogenase [Thermomicrobiales bacterium]